MERTLVHAMRTETRRQSNILSNLRWQCVLGDPAFSLLTASLVMMENDMIWGPQINFSSRHICKHRIHK